MEYRTIIGQNKITYEILRSVFICNITNIDSYAQGMEFVKEVSKKYSDATHNCYAIITKDGQQKFFDDGEPQGTAGIPILQAIKNQELWDIACVVTRYFGGTKLGANGLITSYAKAATDAIDSAKIVIKKQSSIGKLELNYTQHQSYLREIREIEHMILDTQYSDNVQITMAVPLNNKERIEKMVAKTTSGQSQIIWECEQYINY